MKVSREQFEKTLGEAQEDLLQILAHHPDISPKKFYNVVDILQYVTLFSGIIYSVIELSNNKLPKGNSNQKHLDGGSL